METDKFILTVHDKGVDKNFDAELRRTAYSWKIIVFVNEQEIIFEPDEERNFRTLLFNENSRNKIDVELIKNMGETLEELFKK